MSRPAPRARIVVALDGDTLSELPLGIVRQLAHDAAPDLLGLFVEDSRLLAHAESRLAREIVFAGRERALDTTALARHLRGRAAEARRRFEALARDLGATHGFEVRRGDVVGELVRAAAGAAALVIGVGTGAGAAEAWWRDTLERIAEAPVPAVLFARTGWSTGRDIVTVVERGDTTAAALRAAVALAATSRSPLSLLIDAAAAAERDALAALATELAAAAGVELRSLLRAPALTATTILRAAQGARLVVLAQRAASGARLPAALVTRLRAPLLLVDSTEHAARGAPAADAPR